MKKTLLLLVLAAFLLTGCRTRISARSIDANQSGASESGMSNSIQNQSTANNSLSQTGQTTIADSQLSESATQATENPSAEHREYDESASAEAIAGANRRLYGECEENGPAQLAVEAVLAADLLDDSGRRTVTQTIQAIEADRMGTDENAGTADTCLQYYTVLLQERVGSLFECKRQNLYWEMPQDYHTVFNASSEHQLILQSGCYDVSARLLEENLTVNAGWVQRKDPGVIVKIVDSKVLGFGYTDPARTGQIYAQLLSRPDWQNISAVKNNRIVLIGEELLSSAHMRMVALLAIAQTAYPDLFADLDINSAWQELAQEALGTPP